MCAHGPTAIDAEGVERLLRVAPLHLQGRLRGSSNGTMLCTIDDGYAELLCVYKPVSGERPLWDFPDHTLGHREVAAYEVARLLAELDPSIPLLVPVTVWRDDGPLGPGACQQWIADADVDAVDIVRPGAVPGGWLSVLRGEDEHGESLVLAHSPAPAVRRMALFDLITNNSDRKGGHLLTSPDDRLHGVDHGLCFNVDDKVRTVLWGWAGTPLSDDELALLTALRERLPGSAVAEHLSDDEIVVTLSRIDELLERGRFPRPSGQWPAIPWPAF